MLPARPRQPCSRAHTHSIPTPASIPTPCPHPHPHQHPHQHPHPHQRPYRLSYAHTHTSSLTVWGYSQIQEWTRATKDPLARAPRVNPCAGVRRRACHRTASMTIVIKQGQACRSRFAPALSPTLNPVRVRVSVVRECNGPSQSCAQAFYPVVSVSRYEPQKNVLQSVLNV